MLQHHYNQDPAMLIPRKSYYFYKIVLHNRVTYFQAKNHYLSISRWSCLFDGLFEHLLFLDMTQSCSDQLLQLIPQQCPRLQILNATCRLTRLRFSGNATSFAMSVSDIGLGYLVDCKKLRVIRINEARSQRHGVEHSITHNGIRQMLRDIPTLEDVSYSDLGAVVAKDMVDVAQLNLTVVRHYNATAASLAEIFRLCPRLEKLHLIFFNNEQRGEIVELLLQHLTNTLKAIELHNLNFGFRFKPFLQQIGARLEDLTIVNYEEMQFDQLVILAQQCPHLRHLDLSGFTRSAPTTTLFKPPKNFGQLSQLQSLKISGAHLDWRLILTFCTENASHLRTITIGEQSLFINGDAIFLECITPVYIRHLEASSKVRFSKECLLEMVGKYADLKCVSVCCEDVSDDLLDAFRLNNITFFNKTWP